MTPNKKVCTTCNIKKDLSQFYVDRAKKDGYCNECKDCKNVKLKKYAQENKENKRLYDIEYRKKNRAKLQKQSRFWRLNNPDIIANNKLRNKEGKKISDKKYAQKNVEQENTRKRLWEANNPEKRKKSNRDYIKKKLATDPLYRIKHYTRCSINEALRKRGYSKKTKTHNILGCSFDEFKEHIEAQFEPWMNWDNYGNPEDGIFEPDKTWDIDHIIPISTANCEGDVIALNHHTNLQPLCSYDNRFIKKDVSGDY